MHCFHSVTLRRGGGGGLKLASLYMTLSVPKSVGDAPLLVCSKLYHRGTYDTLDYNMISGIWLEIMQSTL